jgi:predicted O-methyltransferase YrrM
VSNFDERRWAAVDDFLSQSLSCSDAVLDAALAASAAAGLPAIQVSACQGRLLEIMVRIHGARRILEIGTLGAYSTICLARGLPVDGHLVTLELEPRHAEVARANLEKANLWHLVDLRVGPALELLPSLATREAQPYDFIFIDADKASTADYFLWALKLSHRGTVIVVDNVVRKGALIDATTTDSAVVGMRRFFEVLRDQNGVTSTAIQTVGSKGYDGFAIVLVTEEPRALKGKPSR